MHCVLLSASPGNWQFQKEHSHPKATAFACKLKPYANPRQLPHPASDHTVPQCASPHAHTVTAEHSPGGVPQDRPCMHDMQNECRTQAPLVNLKACNSYSGLSMWGLWDSLRPSSEAIGGHKTLISVIGAPLPLISYAQLPVKQVSHCK